MNTELQENLKLAARAAQERDHEHDQHRPLRSVVNIPEQILIRPPADSDDSPPTKAPARSHSHARDQEKRMAEHDQERGAAIGGGHGVSIIPQCSFPPHLRSGRRPSLKRTPAARLFATWFEEGDSASSQ